MWTLENGTCVGNVFSIIETCNGFDDQYSYSNFFNSVCLIKNDANCSSFLEVGYKQEAFLKCDKCSNDWFAYLDKCVQ